MSMWIKAHKLMFNQYKTVIIIITTKYYLKLDTQSQLTNALVSVCLCILEHCFREPS